MLADGSHVVVVLGQPAKGVDTLLGELRAGIFERLPWMHERHLCVPFALETTRADGRVDVCVAFRRDADAGSHPYAFRQHESVNRGRANRDVQQPGDLLWASYYVEHYKKDHETDDDRKRKANADAELNRLRRAWQKATVRYAMALSVIDKSRALYSTHVDPHWRERYIDREHQRYVAAERAYHAAIQASSSR